MIALGLVIVQLMANRPEEGWLAWTREAFSAKDDADLDIEPTDFSLGEILDDAAPVSGYVSPDELVRR